ncbi:EFR1 family ferrodoxin [Anaerosporobacter sp.]
MVLYFSGTGNSKHLTDIIADKTKQPLYYLNDAIKKGEHSEISQNETLIFVTPIYGWRIPSIVEEWIHENNNLNGQKVYFVMTCGGGIGNAGKCTKRLCSDKNLQYLGWRGACTHCMTCICACPVSAIEYGDISKGKRRYHCPN